MRRRCRRRRRRASPAHLFSLLGLSVLLAALGPVALACLAVFGVLVLVAGVLRAVGRR